MSTGTHTIRALAEAVAGETNTANNAGNTTISIVDALPIHEIHDVAVASVYAPSEVTKGSTAIISVTVANLGNYTESFRLNVSDETGYSIAAFHMDLNASSTKIFNFAYDTSKLSLGNHTITAIAGYVHNESNLWNNMKSADIIITESPEVHDIAVSSVLMPQSAVKGTPVAINVTVSNLGNRHEIFNLNITDATDSKVVGSAVIALNASASKSFVFLWNTTFASAGNHSIIARVGALLRENNTANNAKNATIAIIPAGGGGRNGSIEMYLLHSANNANVPVTLLVNGSALYNVTGASVSFGDGSCDPLNNWFFGGNGSCGRVIHPEPININPMLAMVFAHNYTANYTGYNVTVNIYTLHGNYSLNKIVPVWIAGDANGDRKVNIIDSSLIGMRWGAAYGTAKYHDGADLNNDGTINMLDSAIVGANWGNRI